MRARTVAPETLRCCSCLDAPRAPTTSWRRRRRRSGTAWHLASASDCGRKGWPCRRSDQPTAPANRGPPRPDAAAAGSGCASSQRRGPPQATRCRHGTAWPRRPAPVSSERVPTRWAASTDARRRRYCRRHRECAATRLGLATSRLRLRCSPTATATPLALRAASCGRLRAACLPEHLRRRERRACRGAALPRPPRAAACVCGAAKSQAATEPRAQMQRRAAAARCSWLGRGVQRRPGPC